MRKRFKLIGESKIQKIRRKRKIKLVSAGFNEIGLSVKV
jgi:hypothetical protein